VARRPEDLEKLLNSQKMIAEAYTLETFSDLVGQYIEAYNRIAHRGDGMNGKSPLEVLHTRESRRVIDADVLDLLLRAWTGELTVGKNGVKVKGLWYGQYDTVLMDHQGCKVCAAYNPDDMSAVHIYDSQTYELVCIAESARLTGYGDTVSEEDIRAGMAARNRAKKIIRDSKPAARTAMMDTASLAIEAKRAKQRKPDKPKTPTIRPVGTPLDGQVARHKQLAGKRAVRKAAGAESIGHVPELDFDFSCMDQSESVELNGLDLNLDRLERSETPSIKLFEDS
jgi:hypothetical protein